MRFPVLQAIGWGLLGMSGAAFGLDRLTFDDERTQSVTIIRQSRDKIVFVDADGKTNTLFKAEIKRIEPGFGEDRFYDSALEETNTVRKILLLRKSVERFPNDVRNHDLLIRLLLSESDTNAAASYLKRPQLRGPPARILWSLYYLRTGNLPLARLHAELSLPAAGQTNLRVEKKVLHALISGLQGGIAAARDELRFLEREFGRPASEEATQRLYLSGDFGHLKKTAESLALMNEQGVPDSQPAFTYFDRYRFSGATNPGLENKKVSLPAPGVLPRKTAQGLAMGSLALGVSSALGWSFAALKFQDLKTRYEGSYFPESFQNSNASLYEEWSRSGDLANVRMTMTVALSSLGAALWIHSFLDPFKTFDRARWARPENHLLITEAAPDPPAKIFFGNLGIFLLALTPDLAFQFATGLAAYTSARKAYDANTDATLFAGLSTDLLREGARVNVALYSLIGSAALGVGSLLLAALDPFGRTSSSSGKGKVSSLFFPVLSADRFEIRWWGIF
ncbi:MAG: hypothetical protein JNM63_09830 [Spirochaetia bacterium]|nr:hypothetical protein [Spirochaetia bacterium]